MKGGGKQDAFAEAGHCPHEPMCLRVSCQVKGPQTLPFTALHPGAPCCLRVSIKHPELVRRASLPPMAPETDLRSTGGWPLAQSVHKYLLWQ